MDARQEWGAALLRIMVGIIFVMHGYDAWTTLGPRGIAGLTTAMGYPPGFGIFLAWYLIAAHVVGGLMIVAGFRTSFAALAQVPIMASAVFLIHWPQGFFMRGVLPSAPAGGVSVVGYEYALLVLVAALVVALLGPGALSLERHRRHRKRLPFP